MLRPLLNLASPAGQQARLSVLVLHRVLAAPDPMILEAMDASRFTLLCGWLKSQFNVLALDDAVRRLQRGTLPARAVAITFDDGYADNLDVATPILRQAGMQATVFVATSFLDGGCMWNDTVTECFRRTRERRVDLRDLDPALAQTPPMDLNHFAARRSALDAVIDAVKYLEPARRLQVVQAVADRLRVPPDDLMLSSGGVAELKRAGMQVGAHTVSHPILTSLSPEGIRLEMLDSKARLEQLTGEPVGLFAYPNGRPGDDYDEQAVATARQVGFEAAFTTVRGAAHRHTDPFQIPRFTPWDRTPLRFGLRMLETLWMSRPGGTAPGPLTSAPAQAHLS